MDMPWGSPAATKFVTNVGLITTNGPNGNNITSMEWTRQLSYSPALIMINPRESRASAENIMKTKVFGVNLAADDQNVAAAISGNATGKEVDKIAVLKELGYSFTKAKNIDVLMLDGSALQLECKLVDTQTMGDHVAFIGEVVNVTIGEKEPLLYHGLKYYKLGEQLHKPAGPVLENIQKLVQKHTKKRK